MLQGGGARWWCEVGTGVCDAATGYGKLSTNKTRQVQGENLRNKVLALTWTSLSWMGAPLDAAASSNTSTKLDTWVRNGRRMDSD